MATTGTKTVRQIVTAALRKARIVAIDQAPEASEFALAIDELERMLKSWQNMGYNLWTKTSGTISSANLTTGTTITLAPVRPLRILSMRFVQGGSELEMHPMTREEYDALPIKTTKGTPTQYYYDRQREAARLYIWPTLSSTTGKEIKYTYERELEDIATPEDQIDVPGEWWDAVVYNLATRLSDTIGIPAAPNVEARAQILLAQAGAFDREASIFFGREDYY